MLHFIFISVLDSILRLVINNDSTGIHLKDGLTINDLDFADEIATVAKSLKERSILCQQIAEMLPSLGSISTPRKPNTITNFSTKRTDKQH